MEKDGHRTFAAASLNGGHQLSQVIHSAGPIIWGNGTGGPCATSSSPPPVVTPQVRAPVLTIVGGLPSIRHLWRIQWINVCEGKNPLTAFFLLMICILHYFPIENEIYKFLIKMKNPTSLESWCTDELLQIQNTVHFDIEIPVTPYKRFDTAQTHRKVQQSQMGISPQNKKQNHHYV